jgi:hypothetical protein
MRISDFYRRQLGCGGVPAGEADWLRIPEHFLATATNGRVFRDDLGAFSGIRDALLPCYPADVKRKKLAARVFVMAQAGQYNFPRSLRRSDAVAAQLSLHQFVLAALSAAYLLSDRYAPYYKWLYRGATELADMRGLVHGIGSLFSLDAGVCAAAVEDICVRFAAELRERGLSASDDAYLEPHAYEIMDRIDSRFLSALHVAVG